MIHTHIGGFEPTKEFIACAYILGCKIEDELNLMLPPSRRKNQYCKSLKRNELKYYEFSKDKNERRIELDSFYLKLHRWLSVKGRGLRVYNDGEKATKYIGIAKNTKYEQHSMGPKCNYDHSTPRYCWLNLIPTAFNTKGGDNSWTIEFRNFNGSSNFTKISNWIKICMAFVHYVENYPNEILERDDIKLLDIIKAAYPKSYKSLEEFINKRITKFTKANTEKDEYVKESNQKVRSIKQLIENV